MYRCWEKTLTSVSTYTNAYRDVKVRVDFYRNGLLRHSAYLFWDGDDDQLVTGANVKRFKFRTFFPYSGNWTWTSVCESGCVNETGGLIGSGALTVSAVPGSETNIFYKFGHIVQAGGYTGSGGIFQYDPIEHAGGARFLWQGDTAWAATLRACHDEWKRYVDDRASRGFTVVQVGLAPKWAGPVSASPFSGTQSRRQVTSPTLGTIRLSPFRQIATGSGLIPNNESRWVSEFWRHLEGMVHYANTKGLLVVVAGVSQPVEEFPAPAEGLIFARNLAARLAGYHVVLSPGFDDQITTTTAALLTAVGEEIYFFNDNMMTASHSGTQASANYGLLQDEPWLRFHLFQSGFNAGNADTIANKARVMPQELRGFTALTPFATIQKPVVNGESIYDYGYGNNADSASLGSQAFNAFQARKTGYLSWMAGASGYTFGAAGIWEWGMCSMLPIPNPATCTDPPAGTVPQSTTGNDFRNFNTAMSAPSSVQMNVMGNAMRASDWWALISNQQSDIGNNGSFTDRRKMVTTRDPDLVLGYLPHNDRIKLITGGKNIDPLNAHFFNPRLINQPLTNPDSILAHQTWQHSYYQPFGLTGALGSDDWVLGLFPLTSAPMTWSAGLAPEDLKTIRAWPDFLDTGGVAVALEVLDHLGKVEAKTTIGRSRSRMLPGNIEAARDGNGRFLVTWEERVSQTGPATIRLVRTDRVGREESELEIPLQSATVERVNPSVAADAAGKILVVWEENDFQENSSSILGQRYLEDGWADGEIFEVQATVPGRPRRPKTACAPDGQCWVAWEVRDEESRVVEIRAQRLDGNREAVGSDLRINETTEGDLWLTSVASREDGTTVFEWESFTLEGESRGQFGAARARAGEVSQGEYRLAAPWEADAQ